MSVETKRFMRMLVFFDLPVVTKEERRAYAAFRRFLLNDGYDMVQFSVYGRLLNGADVEDKHMKRLMNHLPPSGSVRVLTITEKQFASMKLLVGTQSFQEKMSAHSRFCCFEKKKLSRNSALSQALRGFAAWAL